MTMVRVENVNSGRVTTVHFKDRRTAVENVLLLLRRDGWRGDPADARRTLMGGGVIGHKAYRYSIS